MDGDTARTTDQNDDVVALFERRAAALPSSRAIETPTHWLSYGELEQYAYSIAHALTQRQAARGAVVALCFQHGVEFVAALLGVLKSGAAFLPLDPEYPEARLGEALRDSGTQLVLTHAACAH